MTTKNFFDSLTSPQQPPSEVQVSEVCDGQDDCASSGDEFETTPKVTQPLKPNGLLVEQLTAKLSERVHSLGDGLTDDAMRQMIDRLDGIRTGSALNSALHSFAGSVTVTRGGGGGRKIRCQPASLARRQEGKPRGAAPLMRGRPPQAVKEKVSVVPKRPRNLSFNIQRNTANLKSHGAGH